MEVRGYEETFELKKKLLSKISKSMESSADENEIADPDLNQERLKDVKKTPIKLELVIKTECVIHNCYTQSLCFFFNKKLQIQIEKNNVQLVKGRTFYQA